MSGYPKFFDEVEEMELKDPLSEVLGTFEDGLIKIKYLSIVKMAGHSCPTVAIAYLMTLKALKVLYPNSLPVRGEIKVEFKEDESEGVIGVIASVISNITGATEVSGFKGLGGKHSRVNLMFFNSNISSSVRFTRLDSDESVDVFYDHKKVPGNPLMQELMQKVLGGVASEGEKKAFGELWQERVKKILIDFKDDEEVCKIVRV
jgi:formylmethanofuran dehydrogenase subunit E